MTDLANHIRSRTSEHKPIQDRMPKDSQKKLEIRSGLGCRKEQPTDRPRSQNVKFRSIWRPGPIWSGQIAFDYCVYLPTCSLITRDQAASETATGPVRQVNQLNQAKPELQMPPRSICEISSPTLHPQTS